MKNLIFLLLISFIFSSCGDKKDNKTPETAKVRSGDSLITVKDIAPPSNITLNYQLKPGQHYTYKLVNKSSTSQTVVADSTNVLKMEQNLTYKIDMDVQEVEENVMDIKINISSILLDASGMNGQRINYQSGSNLDSLKKRQFANFEALVNSPFFIRLNPDGEINEFYKVDKIVNKFLNLQNQKDSVNNDVKKQIQLDFIEVALRPLLSQIFRKLPGKQLSKDSSWTNVYPSQMPPFELTNTAKFILVDFQKLADDRLAVIDAGLSATSKGKNKVTDRGMNYNFKTPESTGSGKIYFNISKGLIQQSKTSTSVKVSADITIPNSPRGPMKAKSTNMMENSFFVQLL